MTDAAVELGLGLMIDDAGHTGTGTDDNEGITRRGAGLRHTISSSSSITFVLSTDAMFATGLREMIDRSEVEDEVDGCRTASFQADTMSAVSVLSVTEGSVGRGESMV